MSRFWLDMVNARNARYEQMGKQFLADNADKLNRKLDYQEQCAEQLDIIHSMDTLVDRILDRNPGLDGLDTKTIRIIDMDSGVTMLPTKVVYLYNNYVLARDGRIFQLICQNIDTWKSREIMNLVKENIKQVDALNVHRVLQHPYKWDKAPIYKKIRQALERLLTV